MKPSTVASNQNWSPKICLFILSRMIIPLWTSPGGSGFLPGCLERDPAGHHKSQEWLQVQALCRSGGTGGHF
jgi:predicted transcriptional regulator